MVHQPVSRWPSTLALLVCGTLLLVTGMAAPVATASQATDQASNVATDQHHNVHHAATHGLHNISSHVLAQEETPRVDVPDQPIVDNMITVDQVIALQDGWAVVHTLDAQGSPIADQVVGVAEVSAGTNTNVEIELSRSFQAGDELQVMLHIDEGTIGTLEFPSGPDIPVAVDEQIVASNFTVQEAETQSGGDEASATPSPSPEATQMPNTGTSSTTIPPLLIVAGLMMLVAGILRLVFFQPSMQ